MLLPLMASAFIAVAPAHAENESINAHYDALAVASANGFSGTADLFDRRGLFVFLTQDGPGPLVTGAQMPARTEAMGRRLQADGMTLTTAYRLEKRSVIGDVSVDSGYMKTTQTLNGSARSHYARFLVTWKRDGDHWRLISDAAWPSDEAAYNAVPRTPGLKYDS